MATAESLHDDMDLSTPGPSGIARQPRRDSITMLQVDDLYAHMVHNLEIIPIDDSVVLPEITDDAHDQSDDTADDIHVDAVLDLEGVSIDDPVRMYLREIGRVPSSAPTTKWPSPSVWSAAKLSTASSRISLPLRLHSPAEVICLEVYEALVENWQIIHECLFLAIR